MRLSKQIFTIFSLCIFFNCSYSAKCQQLPINLRFNKFTTENGLSDNHIGVIIKDKKGFLWMNTQNGIDRFDGVEFKKFLHSPVDSNSLLSNGVSCVAEDSLKRIWCATYKGLSVYNPLTGKFWNYEPDEKFFIKKQVAKVLIAKDGSLWFDTWNRLNTIDLHTFKITSYLIDSLPANPEAISAGNFYEDHEGNFWLDSYHGLSFFNRKTHHVKLLDANYGLGAFYDDDSGHAWLGAWQSSLREYDFNTKKFTDYYFDDKNGTSAVRNVSNILSIHKKGLKNLIWVGTEQGLAIFNISTNHFVNYYSDKSPGPNKLPVFGTGYIFYDERNQLWIGTNDGLYALNLNQLPIQTLYFDDNKNRAVTRIRQDIKDSNILLASLYVGGLYAINRFNGEIKYHFLPGTKKPFDYLNDIEDFVQDSSGIIWCASSNQLIKFNPYRHTFQFIKAPLKELVKSENDFYSLILSKNGKIWFGASAGLGYYDMRNNSFHYYFNYPHDSIDYFEAHAVQFFRQTFDGKFWIFNSNDGLLVFNPATERFISVNISGVDLKHVTNHAILQCPDSSMWIATGEQLFRRKITDTAFHAVFNSEMDAGMYKLASDSYSNIYIGMQNGLLKYEKQTGRFIKYTTADGLIESQVYTGLDTGKNNTVYIRGTGSLSIVDTKKLNKQFSNANLVFESLTINEKDTAIDFELYHDKTLKLNYTQNQLAFHFRLLNLSDASQVQYEYKLDGWDKTWISSNTGNYAAYSNLNGGNYTFHVKAINPDGTLNKQEAILLIHINFPFWKTWWFYSLCILCLFALLYFIYTLRMQRLLAVEKIRSKISRDLHDDVGSTLTSINIWSDVAGRQLETDASKSSEYIYRIRNSSQNMLDNMNDIIWAINPINDTLEKVLIRMKLYASEMLEPKDIDFKFNVDEQIKSTVIPMQYRRELYLIFKEAVNNAAKYSSAKCIEVNIQLHQHNFKMCIKDNGKGFIINDKRNGNGLQNMQQRAKQIKAQLQVNSSIGNGTEIILNQRIT